LVCALVNIVTVLKCMHIFQYVVADLYNVSVITHNTQIVGQPLTLECSVTTVRGIISRVDVVWSINASEISITEGVNVTFINKHSATYSAFYNIPLLSTADDGRVYQCEIVINTSPPVMIVGSVRLDVTGLFVVTCKTE